MRLFSMINNEAKRELLIPFESFLNRGIHKDNSKIFEDSFFKDVYSQAREAIVIIDEANKKKNNDIAEKGNCEQELYDVQNVIAFTGRRGTGKTSAMLTFVDNLATGKIDFSTGKLKNTRFYPIPYIDASMLEKNEDIFEIVLSKMLLEINKISIFAGIHGLAQNEIRLNSIREDIVNVYNQYASLKKASGFDSASSCSVMEKMAERHDICSKIVELVKNYIDCMNLCVSNQYENRYSNGYLVICIDDIDMSQKNHMDVMQAIYQYLMIPRIIVMITSNFSMLSASIEQKFHSKVYVSAIQAQAALNLAKEQTYDFLRKIIPFDMRISMPSWRKQDYRSLNSIKVNFGNDENLQILEGLFSRFQISCLFNEEQRKEDCNKLSPKVLIMLMIAYRTKAFLDVAGEKLHFMEPDSLRNLNDLFYLLYNMNNINKDKDEKEEYYRKLEANRKVLLNYLYFKMIPELNLSTDEEQVIKEFSRDKLHRKGRRIWDYYYKCFTKKSEKTRIERLYGAKFYKKEISKNRVEYYSFGEFFRVLYFGSRLNLMSREFIKVILASFSIIMPQFIEMEKDYENKLKEKREKEGENDINVGKPSYSDLLNIDDRYRYKPIRDVFKYTLLGTWCEDLFDNRTVDIVVKEHTIGDVTDLKRFIHLLMLTTVSTGETIKVRKVDGKIRIPAKLDPTALFMNLVRINRIRGLKFEGLAENEYNGTLQNFLLAICRKYTAEGQSQNADQSQNTDQELNLILHNLKGTNDAAYLLEKLFEILNKDYSDFLQIAWFLLKNIDITYNVIKRVVIYLIYLSDNNLRDKKTPKPTPEEAIASFYLHLKKKLNEEFEVYNKSKVLDWNFEETFNCNPVIELFLGDSNTTSKGSAPYNVSEKIRKMSGNNIYIDWSDKMDYAEQNPPSGDMSLKTMFDMCSKSCPASVSTLKRLYTSSLTKDISRRDAIKIIALILDNKAGEAATEISKLLNNKGDAAT